MLQSMKRIPKEKFDSLLHERSISTKCFAKHRALARSLLLKELLEALVEELLQEDIVFFCFSTSLFQTVKLSLMDTMVRHCNFDKTCPPPVDSFLSESEVVPQYATIKG